MPGNKTFRLILFCLLLADIVYSFRQHYGKPLDGDIVPIALPSPHYEKVMADPFGIRALTKHEHYANPNRYFSHVTLYFWFRDAYNLFTEVMPDRINALYLASALFNSLTQVLLILLLAVYVCGHARITKFDFLAAACLIFPFIQVHGFYTTIGLVDQAVSYTFFYGFPIALLLLYFLPFWLYHFHGSSHVISGRLWMYPVWTALSVYLAFSGPLIPAVSLLLAGFISLYFLIENRQNTLSGFKKVVRSVPFFFKYGLLLLMVLCLYSYYIGTFNAEALQEMPLIERYQKWLEGLLACFTRQAALPLMLILLLVNFLVGRIKLADNSSFSLKPFLWPVSFILLYLLLLPLGGYRAYRPLIIRYDTFMPVSVVLIFFSAYTTHRILQDLNGRILSGYITFVVLILSIFLIVDKPRLHDKNCQREGLRKIQRSKEPVVYIGNACTELTWWAGYDTAGTRNISEMLYQWGITDHYQAFGGDKP